MNSPDPSVLCLRDVFLQKDAYENVWHLVVPPLMALLDDYEARHKLQGVVIVQEMLLHAPKDVLKRTGIGALFKQACITISPSFLHSHSNRRYYLQSLRTCLSHLQSPETPELLKHAIDASVSLILLITTLSPTRPSPERFDELSSLLGEGIITGIWLYSADKPDVVQATFDALPGLLAELDVGSTRFLKVRESQSWRLSPVYRYIDTLKNNIAMVAIDSTADAYTHTTTAPQSRSPSSIISHTYSGHACGCLQTEASGMEGDTSGWDCPVLGRLHR